MGNQLQPLVSTTDPDWGSFSSGDADYYLRAAGTTIRKYCGWHLWPSMTVTKTNIEPGSRGIILLPSRYVTDVTQVVLDNPDPTQEGTILDPSQYQWFQDGWIQRIGQAWAGWGWGWPGGYYYGPDAPYYMPAYNYGLVDVTFTHGYDILPDDIKQVAFELAKMMTSVAPGLSNVKEVQSPQYRTAFWQQPGLNLNEMQKCKLANYQIGRFA